MVLIASFQDRNLLYEIKASKKAFSVSIIESPLQTSTAKDTASEFNFAFEEKEVSSKMDGSYDWDFMRPFLDT